MTPSSVPTCKGKHVVACFRLQWLDAVTSRLINSTSYQATCAGGWLNLKATVASSGPPLETTFWEDSCEGDAQEAARLGSGVARSLTVSFAAVSSQFTSSAQFSVVCLSARLQAVCRLPDPRASYFQHVNLMDIPEVVLQALAHFCWVRHPPSFLVTQALLRTMSFNTAAAAARQDARDATAAAHELHGALSHTCIGSRNECITY